MGITSFIALLLAGQQAAPVSDGGVAETNAANARALADAAAQTARIKRDKEAGERAAADYARATAEHARQIADYEAEKAAVARKAAADQAAYDARMAAWRAEVAAARRPAPRLTAAPHAAAQVVCHTETKTGSNMPQRVCRREGD